MNGDLIETFKISYGVSNYGRHFFQYFSLNWELTVKTDFKSTNQLDFLANMFLEKIAESAQRQK